MGCKLSLAALLSTLFAFSAAAHEVLPAIADLRAEDGDVSLTIDLNLEAYLSGIDLDGLENTDDAEQNDSYTTLRSAEPDVLRDRVPSLIAQWNALPLLAIDGAPVTLEPAEILIPEVGNTDLPRPSRIVLRGAADGAVMQVAWPKGAGELLLREAGVDDPFTGYIRGGATSPELAIGGGNALTGWGAFAQYIPVGFDHILPKGLDHILFVLGLFFLSAKLGALLWQVTAFTAAHTVTLALGALGWVNVPGSIVEPLIAASICYVAIENILIGRLTPWRPALIFGFGLLHGLGFASVLGEFGLPEGQFIPALLGFNVGVELGQLTVIAIAALLVGWFAGRDWYRPVIAIPASAVIALIGAYWVVERTLL
ncbi:HupE/UreJ family protein [Aliishimia ponticola]|nr:HupE/UreJ family protein [Aliishimia ponticola]